MFFSNSNSMTKNFLLILVLAIFIIKIFTKSIHDNFNMIKKRKME